VAENRRDISKKKDKINLGAILEPKKRLGGRGHSGLSKRDFIALNEKSRNASVRTRCLPKKRGLSGRRT